MKPEHRAGSLIKICGMSTFQREIQVRFGHCDPAGWVFYPRYFEMISSFVEDWFEDGLEASAPGLMHHKGILTPSVHFDVDFPRPARYGDRLTFRLWVTKVGRSSCQLRIEASLQEEICIRAQQILVFVRQETRRATPIPTEIAQRMRRYLADPPRPSNPAAKPKSKRR